MQGRPSEVNASLNTVTMFGWWDSWPSAWHSRSNVRRASSEREPGVQDLDRHVAVHRALASPVHDREPAGTDLVDHLVALDGDREPAGGYGVGAS